ncbi:MAG: zinc ribbon domain-containing protein [Candidatus Methanomethylicaceae archaeon]
MKYVAESEGVIIKEIKPSYISQTCPRCRYTGRER